LADRGFVIDLPIRERWQVVDVLRTAVYQCLAVVFDADAFAEVISMVVGELVENALKHGAWDGDAEPKGNPARLRILSAPAGVQIEVSNPLPQGSDPKLIFSMLDRIRSAPTPQDAYVERLREVARDVTARGGLGLMRIAFEANASLSAVVAENQITVRAAVGVPVDGLEGAATG
jgi:hypothetical protein